MASNASSETQARPPPHSPTASPRCRRAAGRADPRPAASGRSRTRTRPAPTRARAGSQRDTRREVSPSASGTTDQHGAGVLVAGRRDRPWRDRARPAPGNRQQPPAPVILGRVARVRAHHHRQRRRWTRPSPVLCRGPPGRRGPRSPRRRTARRNAVAASSEARSGARTRSTSEAISVVTRLSIDGSGSRSRVRMRRCPTVASATLRSIVVDVLAVTHQRALIGRRARRDREDRARPVDQDQARVERPAGRRRTSGSPAPPCTASVIAAAPRGSGPCQRLSSSHRRQSSRPDPWAGQNQFGHCRTIHAPSTTPIPTKAAST